MAEALAQQQQQQQAARCTGCGTQLAPALLTCPSCQRLVHAEALKALAAEAEAAPPERARELWERALGLLPPASAQHARVREKVQALAPPAHAAAPAQSSMPRWLAPLGAVGLLLWKFKAALAFVLLKGKFLLVGLTKLPTLLSMFAAFGFYVQTWGWAYAAGFVACIYVHEMGHVWALRRHGIAADAPMFIPFVGAFVRMREAPPSAEADAEIGLAGPLWGLGVTAVFYALARLTRVPLLDAIAHTSAVINLFNLVPVWQLDGARGFRAMTREQRIWVTVALGVAWFASREGVLLLVGVVALVRCFTRADEGSPSWRAAASYAGLVVLLSGLAWAAQGVAPPR